MNKEYRARRLRLLSLERINKMAQVKYDVGFDADTIRRVRYDDTIPRSEENKNTYNDELGKIYCAIIGGDPEIAPGIVFFRIYQALNQIKLNKEDRVWVDNITNETGLLEHIGFLYSDEIGSPSTMTTQKDFKSVYDCKPPLLV